MKTFAYTKESLEDFLTQKDCLLYGVNNLREQEEAISLLHEKVKYGSQPFSFSVFQKNGREMCKPSDIQTAILVKKVNHDFARLTKSRVQSRGEIIWALRALCAEGQAMTLIRLDIKKFFQSVNTDELQECAAQGVKSTYALRRIIEQYLDWARDNVRGVPTGISLSSSLTEYYLKERLDCDALATPGVHFYRRYVDDIIMVCSPDFKPGHYVQEMQRLLPDGLTLNNDREKKSILKLHHPRDEGSFNYLGYNFKVGAKVNSRNASSRVVTLDIAPSKVKARKIRFVKTLLQFLRDGREDDLRRRFLLLNSGYTFWDPSRGREMSAGLCNSYSEIDNPSESLKSLQGFYRSCMLNPNFQLYHRIRLSHLSKATRRMIVSFDLERHFFERKHFRFSSEELQHLSSCWKT
ncbi:hypothetical protein JMK10_20125 [Rhodovulum sulfidophilum]|uniref:antiviral reverse transcriptase Drt3a n=1 Tax=Rhodovulum sulfidophilum TaxID=35806 RepID=UPI00192362DC|nr:antiviral reverse transcriptase Drt3a [Rhodovulum sulfidophilum]MBL3576179.1 hypothetical protein [Rhodovulum sulfidophilum]MCE8433470.1 hypothetical protein [Rhodovulum sulfidophilum]MCF4119007.1 hypothetical protein [Rhodovulum sulfidophilum]